jgi:phosphoglycolate phosphatase
MDKPPLERELIYSYVGNGAPVLIRRAMGPEAAEAHVREALAFFLDYYRNHAVVHTELYPGVRESLERFHKAGMQLAVLTNKPVRISNVIMEHFGLSRMMFRVYGGNSFEHKKPHPIGIDSLRAEAGAAESETWMIGDSAVDVQTARNAGVPCCGVTYGFQPETLAASSPDLIVDNLERFADRLL